MRAEAGERIEIERQRRDERLALAGRHLRDHPAMQARAADELHVEVDHVPDVRLVAHHVFRADEPARGVLHRGESLGQNLSQHILPLHGIADLSEPLLPLRGLRAELVVGEFLEGLVVRVDLGCEGIQRFDETRILRADDLFNEPGNHV